jgi:hypothetical protein
VLAAFATVEAGLCEWVWRPGSCTVRAGRSSRDLSLSARVVLSPVGVTDGGDGAVA